MLHSKLFSRVKSNIFLEYLLAIPLHHIAYIGLNVYMDAYFGANDRTEQNRTE
uniref:Uncharacterized protein n=1 Tax=Arundo donax TaxID=35708 RepID=A0A0A8ZJ01_ARUDO